MANINNNNTIVENVEYLDMLDPKNSWYFDAEKFDVNFPLVYSYRGQDEDVLFLMGWNRYWVHVFSYYQTQNMTAILLTRPQNSFIDYSPYNGGKALFPAARVYFEESFCSPEFAFYLRDLHNIDSTYHRFLFAARLEDFSEVKYRFFAQPPLRSMNYFNDPFNARSQLIITKDWNLVHRYYNWVFRNHQYENSSFTYYLEDRGVKLPENQAFKNIYEMATSDCDYLPRDYRNYPREMYEIDDNELLGPEQLFSHRFRIEIKKKPRVFLSRGDAT